MAYEYVCRHCGQQGPSHSDWSTVDNPEQTLPNFEFSLTECPGFQYSDEDQAYLHELEIVEEEGAHEGQH